MRHRNHLSYQFNMALGFIPTILSMILLKWVSQDVAIYCGAFTGVIATFFLKVWKKTGIPRVFLHTTTGMLIFLSLFTVIIDEYCPSSLISLTLEIATLLPPAFLWLHQKKISVYILRHSSEPNQQRYASGIEAAIASAKVVLLLGCIHFLLISGFVVIQHPLNPVNFTLLFQVIPPTLFIIGILFNQFGIYYFNRLLQKSVYIPIVNTQGDVIGKRIASEALNQKTDYISPVIRIAITAHGMLYLKPRSKKQRLEQGKNDLPIEGYLTFGESLEQGVRRLTKQILPHISLEKIHFNLKYHYQNQSTNRLVYLFSLDLKDDSSLTQHEEKGAKLWTTRQIDTNLQKHFFSSYFEYEYKYLKTIIYTKEKCKES